MNINTNYIYETYFNVQTNRQRQVKSVSSFINKDDNTTLSAEELAVFAADYNQKTGMELDIASVMESYDGDGDGALSDAEQELMNGEQAMEKLLFPNKMYAHPAMAELEAADANGDGLWGAEELAQFADLFNSATGGELNAESLLTEYDADGDGSLNQDELVEMIGGMLPPPPASMAEGQSGYFFFPAAEDEELLMARRAIKASASYENAFWYEDSINSMSTRMA